MSAIVLPIGDVVAQLQTAEVYRKIGGAFDLSEALRRNNAAAGYGFVLPAVERTSRQGVSGGVLSAKVTATFSVISIEEDLARDAGAGAVTKLEALRGSLIQALATWNPDFADGPAWHEKGQLVAGPMPGGLLGWQDEFSIRFRRTITGG